MMRFSLGGSELLREQLEPSVELVAGGRAARGGWDVDRDRSARHETRAAAGRQAPVLAGQRTPQLEDRRGSVLGLRDA